MPFENNYFPSVITGMPNTGNSAYDFLMAKKQNAGTYTASQSIPEIGTTVSAMDFLKQKKLGLSVPSIQQPTDTEDKLYDGNYFSRSLDAVTQVLEPLQLPQDILFAYIRGFKDDKTSMSEQFGNLWNNLPAYVNPMKAAPRPTNGQDILSLYGVQDGIAKKVGGFALDIFADPLMVGGFVKGAGKIAKGLGAVADGERLIKIGGSIDKVLSLEGMYKLLPKPQQAYINNALEGFAKRIFNVGVGSKINQYGNKLTIGDYLLPERRALQLQLGLEEGADVSKVKALAQADSIRLEDSVLQNLQNFEEILGASKQSWMQNVRRVFTGMGKQRNTELPKELKDVIEESIYELRQYGGLVGDEEKLKKFSNSLATNATTASEISEQSRLWNTKESLVSKVASKYNLAPDFAIEKMRLAYKEIASADIKLSEAVSLVKPAQSHFSDKLLKMGLSESEANLMWENLQYQGIKNAMTNEASRKADLATLMAGGVPQSVKTDSIYNTDLDNLYKQTFNTTQSPFPISGNNKPITLKEFLSDTVLDNARLNLDNLFEADAYGHLRRSFGIMLDDNQRARYLKSLTEKKLIPSSLVDRQVILPAMQQKGFDVEGKMITDYFDNLNPTGDVGLIRSADQLIDLLTSQGIAPKRAVEAFKAFQSSLGSKTHQDFLLKVEKAIERYTPSINQLPSGSGATFYQPRVDFQKETFDVLKNTLGRLPTQKELDVNVREQLEILGELASPKVSITQQANAARKNVSRIQFIERMKTLVAKYPSLVSDSKSAIATHHVQDIELGFLNGKYVHPFLQKELYRFLGNEDKKFTAFDKINSLITSGYLASPKSVLTNIPGGLTMGAFMGLNPLEMLREMGGTMVDLNKKLKDPSTSIADFEELTSRVGLELSNLSATHATKKDITEDALKQLNIGKEGLGKILDTATEFYQKHFIEKPLGLPIGLSAFGFWENVMKVSAYRVAKKNGFSLDEAAEIARISTFDQSQLPELLKTLKDTGLFLFPGFPYFTAGRLAHAAVSHPASLGMANRLADAYTDIAVENPDEKLKLSMGMDDWLKQPQNRGVPVFFTTDKEGNRVAHVIPLAQLVPTTTAWGENFMEGAASLGLYRPIVEALNATIKGDGKAVFSERFGQRVFDQGATDTTRFAETLGFLYNAFAPATARSLISYNSRKGVTGLVPELLDSAIPVVTQSDNAKEYSLQERSSLSPDRTVLDDLISFTVRSSKPIAIQGSLAGYQKQYEVDRIELRESQKAIKTRYKRLILATDNEQEKNKLISELETRLEEKTTRFNQRWQPFMSYIQSKN